MGTGRFKIPERGILLGVSVEDKKTADERIPLLLKTPAARGVSYEPALGPVDFRKSMAQDCDDFECELLACSITIGRWLTGLSWAGVRPGARPMHPIGHGRFRTSATRRVCRFL